MKQKRPPFKLQVRHYTALVSGFIYNLNVFGLSARNICSPGFNCHGCPWATFSCPVGIIGYGFGVRAIPAFALGSVLALGLVFGRLVCAYACPVGLGQELLYRIPGRKLRMPRVLRYGKYLTLLLLVFGLTWLFGFAPRAGFIQLRDPEVNKYTVTTAAEAAPAAPASTQGADGAEPLAGGIPPAPASDPLAALGLPQVNPARRTVPVIPGFAPPVAVKPAAQVEPFEPQVLMGDPRTLLRVDLEVVNLSEHTVEGFEIEVAYYTEAGEVLWAGRKPRHYAVTLAPGETYRAEPFTVPYMLDEAGLVVTSPQSSVKLDYWNLFCTYCPVAALQVDLPSVLAGSDSITQAFYRTTLLSIPRLLITFVIVALCIFITRFFCRALCPLGAMYALCSVFGLSRIEVVRADCNFCSREGGGSCKRCDAVCPVELDVFHEAGGVECIACGACIGRCPSGAIKRRFGV